MFKILFIILALFYTDSFAKKKTGRISFGGGLHNFMKNGYSICRAPAYGGCDPNSSANAALPVPYKEISTVFSFEYFAKRNIKKNALAISSNQSNNIASYEDVYKNYKKSISEDTLELCPEYWDGYSFIQYYFEFWAGHSERINKSKVYEMKHNK